MERPHHLNSVLHVFICLVSLCVASAFSTDGVVTRARDEGEEDGSCMVSVYACSTGDLGQEL